VSDNPQFITENSQSKFPSTTGITLYMFQTISGRLTASEVWN